MSISGPRNDDMCAQLYAQAPSVSDIRLELLELLINDPATILHQSDGLNTL
jgi:hypothetical protein